MWICVRPGRLLIHDCFLIDAVFGAIERCDESLGGVKDMALAGGLFEADG